MKKNRWVLYSAWFLVVISLNFFSVMAQGQQSSKIQPIDVTLHTDIVEEGFLKKYLYPLIPFISILAAAYIGKRLSHYYWKKKDESLRRKEFYDQKLRCYLDLTKHLLQFNACTHVMMERHSQIEELEKKETKTFGDEKRLQSLWQIYEDYEARRLEPMSGLRQAINNASIFFSSADVSDNAKEYVELNRKLRKQEVKWTEELFLGEFVEKGLALQTAMGNELKQEFQKP